MYKLHKFITCPLQTNAMKPIEIIIAAISHIEARLGERLTLESVARRLGYSQYYLHHLFTQTVGLPMNVYIQRRRLTEGARQLVHSKRSILEIALQSGYGSQQAFATIFKTMYKLPPGRFRQNRKFYPLQMPFEFERPVPEMHSRDDAPAGRLILPAGQEDTTAWMRLVIDGFPCLNETEHAATLKDYIKREQAFIMKEKENAIGVMMLSPASGSIDFLGIHPLYRQDGIMQAHLAKAMGIMAAHPVISTTTFRRGDRADTGHRRRLKAFGFTEGKLLVEFGYPTQKMLISANHVF